LKIAFLTGSTHKVPRLGGEARVFHLAKTLASGGISVDLFGSRFGEELLGPDVSQFQAFRTWSGGDWYPLSIKSVPTLVKNVPSLARLGGLLRGYDAVISELGCAWQALCCKQINSTPVVLDEHNVEWSLMRQQEISAGVPHPWKRLRLYERICHEAFDDVIVVSAVDRAAFEAGGTPATKMTLVPNGVDTHIFRPDAEAGRVVRKECGLRNDDLVVMYMGSLKFFPNIDAVNSILKKIYPRAQAMIPNLKLLITGPESEDLRDPTSHDIISTGVVDRSLLPSYINAADVCLAPLRFGSGTRYKILEWMACGKAIIATRKAAEGIEVSHGDNILLEDDVDQYPKLISELLGDQVLRTELGDNARHFAVENYDWDKCVAPLGELLRRL